MTTRATQPVTTVPGQRYSEAGKQAAAQREIPLPDRTQTPVSGGASPQGGPVPRPNVFSPTERPNEPLTAGAPGGAGPDNLGLLPPDPVAHIRALYNLFPNEELRRLLERASQ